MKRLVRLSACVALAVTSNGALAATMSVSNTAPAVDGADIASLVGTTDVGGNPGHLWSNRPRQGQSFTTGSNSLGYILNAVTLRTRVDQPSTTSPNWEVRFGSISGTDVFSTIATENATGVAIPNGNPGDWVTWAFSTPLELDPNTVYGFDVYPSGSGFISMNATTDPYAGGGGFSSGSPGSGAYPLSPPNPLTFHTDVDRNFHVNLSANTPAPAPEPSSLLLVAIGVVTLGMRRRSNRQRC